ncbi:putative holin-like toxin [Lacrimispora sp.]
MDTYQILTLLFLGGSFLIALLAYLDNRDNKPKK